MTTGKTGSTEQQKQIPTEMGKLADNIDRIAKAIENLEGHLNPILTPAEVPEKAPEDEKSLVILAEEIRSARYRIASHCIAIERLSERQEV